MKKALSVLFITYSVSICSGEKVPAALLKRHGLLPLLLSPLSTQNSSENHQLRPPTKPRSLVVAAFRSPKSGMASPDIDKLLSKHSPYSASPVTTYPTTPESDSEDCLGEAVAPLTISITADSAQPDNQ